jgi:hypothetical protein
MQLQDILKNLQLQDGAVLVQVGIAQRNSNLNHHRRGKALFNS